VGVLFGGSRCRCWCSSCRRSHIGQPGPRPKGAPRRWRWGRSGAVLRVGRSLCAARAASGAVPGAATSTSARDGRGGVGPRRPRRRPPPRRRGVILSRSAGRRARLLHVHNIRRDAASGRMRRTGFHWYAGPDDKRGSRHCEGAASRFWRRDEVPGVPPVRIPGRAGRACPGAGYGADPGGRHGLCHWPEGPRGAYASGRPSETSIVTGEVST
jgi:hypothetical protein